MPRINTEALFPKDLKADSWQEFEAAGFKNPVSGIIYRDGSVRQGLPLGGLGTGFIPLGTDGTLDYYSTIFNAFLERHDETHPQKQRVEDIDSLKLPFLGLAVDGRAYVLTLEDVPEVQTAKQIHYWGHYPVADCIYEIDAPVEVSLRAWVPFLPGDAAGSNVPGAVFEVTVTNSGDSARQISPAFSFHGPRNREILYNAHGKRQSFDGQAVFTHRPIDTGGMHGLRVETSWEDFLYEYSIFVAGGGDVRTGGELRGEDWQRITGSLPAAVDTAGGGSAAADFSLAPGETRTLRFILGWYAPYWRAQGYINWTNETLKDYRHRYADRFADSTKVAGYLAEQADSLSARILAWQETVYTETALPVWLRDALVNVFAVLPQESFWMLHLQPDHWWGADGLFCVNETLVSCPQLGCIINDCFGQWPVDLFFPDLARNKLRPYRYYTKRSGQIPSTLGMGSEPDYPWYDQQLTVDGAVYIQMIDRIRQVTGDTDFLRDYYPEVKRQVAFSKSIDQDGDGIPDAYDGNQPYDSQDWDDMKGTAVHAAGFWMTSLLIAERMAQEMNDDDFAAECRALYEQARESVESILWNEEGGYYLLCRKPAEGTQLSFVLSDQLTGQWQVEMHGLEDIFPPERVKRVLDTVWKQNVASTDYGVRVAICPDGSSPSGSTYLNLVMAAYPTIVPAMLSISHGEYDRGDRLLRRVWEHILLEMKMPWDFPLGLNADTGDFYFGLQYYHNTMLWSTLGAYLKQDLRELCAQGNIIDRITRAARPGTAE